MRFDLIGRPPIEPFSSTTERQKHRRIAKQLQISLPLGWVLQTAAATPRSNLLLFIYPSYHFI